MGDLWEIEMTPVENSVYDHSPLNNNIGQTDHITQTKKSLFCITDWQSDSVNATILLFFAKLFRPSKQQLSSSFAFPFIYTLESIID